MLKTRAKKTKLPAAEPLIPEQKRVFGRFILGLYIWLAVFSVVLLILWFQIARVANRKVTTVQLMNGAVIQAIQEEGRVRAPQVIQGFVKDWAYLTFNSEVKKGSTIQKVPVKDSSEFLTPNAEDAALLLAPDLATPSFKKTLAQTIGRDVVDGQQTSTIDISFVSAPRGEKTGPWEVDMVATRILKDPRTGATETLAFNRTFELIPVEINEGIPIPNQSDALATKLYRFLSRGLKISRIKPYYPNKGR